MNNFKTYLEEGRDAPLYHGTHPSLGRYIIEEDFLRGETNHTNKWHEANAPGRERFDKQFSPKKMVGSSLTRDFKFAKRWKFVNTMVFEINQRKLAQRHKIIPFYLEGITQHSRISPDDFYKGTMREEFVVGDVKNFMAYVTKIHLEEKSTKIINALIAQKKAAHIKIMIKDKEYNE